MIDFNCGGDWLVAYADDELTGDDHKQAAEHLAGCERCQYEFTALRSSLLQVQSHWQAPQAVVAPQYRRWTHRANVLARAAIVAAVALTLGWQLTTRRDSSVALAPTTNTARNDLESDAAIDEFLKRETQIARLRTASALLAQEPGMQERGEQLEQYLSRTYGN
jgi:hypothetical protein